MAYKKFQATQLFNGQSLLDHTHVLITSETGVIQDIVTETDAGNDIQKLEGTLSPGFFNCHCHLELSHLKEYIPPGGGLTSFIASVMKAPQASAQQKEMAMRAADKEMYDNGIVAVGDISNNSSSFNSKSQSNIEWYNFLEIANLDDHKAQEKISQFQEMENTVKPMQAALSPHACYSVSPETFRLINERTEGKTITIHNQESAAEDELFTNGTGYFLSFYEGIGRKNLPVTVSGKSSLQTWLPYFTKGQSILLVHNTYITEEDILYANDHAKAAGLTLFYCLCPNANFYIEKKVPPVELLLNHGCNIVLGTDSYGSNWQLNIASEMQLINRHFPSISPEKILQWATANGAQALKMQNGKGYFEKGKKPGIVLIQNNFGGSKRLL